MQNKNIQFKIKGMNRDLSVSAFSSEYSYENKNLRITPLEDNTLASLVNEKGNIPLNINNTSEFIAGVPIGQAVLNNELVLFTHVGESDYYMPDVIDPLKSSVLIDPLELEVSDIDLEEKDYIYVLSNNNDNFSSKILYEGNLNFSTSHPLETIPYYENEYIKKIYWVDGINQPRYINIAADSKTIEKWNDNSFDFTVTTTTTTELSIENIPNGGYFPSGVVQYLITTYNKNGKESAPLSISPLYYTYIDNRGGSPEENTSNSFRLTIIVDKEHILEYIRIYSIVRTSLNGTPICKIVSDLKVEDQEELSYTDTNLYGEDIDYTKLLYLGGEDIVASAIGIKDNTLFLGNLKLNQHTIDDSIRSEIRNLDIEFTNIVELGVPISDPTNTTYSYDNNLQYSSDKIKTFKYLEWYRFGLQFKHKSGKWSEPIFIRDKRNTVSVGVPNVNNPNGAKYFPVIANLIDNDDKVLPLVVERLHKEGFVSARPVIVYPREEERECVCQGILCPTLFNLKDRCDGDTYSVSSWFVRPQKPYDEARTLNSNNNTVIKTHHPKLNVTLEYTYYNGDDLTFIDYSSSSEYLTKRDILSSSSRSTIKPQGDQTYTTDHEGSWYGNYAFNRIPYRTIAEKGAWLNNTHLIGLPDCYQKACEIQCSFQALTWPTGGNGNNQSQDDSLIDTHSDEYFVDQSVLTLHSPDIEFNDNISKQLNGVKLRIVGAVPLTAYTSDIDIQANSPSAYVDKAAENSESEPTYSGNIAPGFVKTFNNVEVLNVAHRGGRCLCSYPFWHDELYNYDARFKEKANNYHRDTAFVVYPWHREGCLNNSDRTDSGASSLLLSKTMSNLRYSWTTQYLDLKDVYYAYKEGDDNKRGITGAALFNSNELAIVKIPNQIDGEEDIIYQGNVDKLLYKSTSNYGGRYPICTTIVGPLFYEGTNEAGYRSNRVTYADPGSEDFPGIPGFHLDGDSVLKAAYDYNNDYLYELLGGNYNVSLGLSTTYSGAQPIRISYKSTPHIVLALKNTKSGKQITLPTILNGNKDSTWYINSTFFTFDKDNLASTHLLWDKDRKITGTTTDIVNLVPDKNNGLNYGFLWLGELYRDDITNRFGGDSEYAIQQNEWLICGDEIDLDAIGSLTWKGGDTYYQRYDHLKTYPFGEGYKNNIVDIVSFMCETRVNIDGRYDRNRGLKNNTNINPSVFNQLNTVYSQSDNFFTYRALDYDTYESSQFLNTITWSSQKSNGQDIDPWTNISMLNTYDLDGRSGVINAIKTINNSLIAFQDKSISEILYNMRTQLSTTEGVPVELGSSGKVEGVRYISNFIGCQNKWSICQSPNGLYFTDDISKSIYLFNNSLTNLSDSKGFHSWVKNNSVEGVTWDPVTFENMVTYYDNTTGDVLFITDKECLAYNELVGEFVSFYSYEKTPYILSVKDSTLAIRPSNNTTTGDYEGAYKIWKQHEGPYNDFYNTLQPFYIQLIVNPNPSTDKIFNIVELKADSFYEVGEYWYDHPAFDKLDVYNEYQSNSVELKLGSIGSSNLKKKFRTWRITIPRDSKNNRDRFRNPWLNIKLAKTMPSSGIKTIIHDLIVHYFE